MKEKGLISVIMPVYNGEKYLEAAVKSILNQTYDKFELIIIDDSHHKKCFKIITSLNDNRIKYLIGPKINLASALNFGIKQAKGEFIARMDSDDISDPNRFKLQLETLLVNGWDICGSWIRLFGSDNRLYIYPSSPLEIKYSMLFTCAIAHPTILARSDIFYKYSYNENSCVEDYELWTRMLADNIIFGNVTIPLLKYRRHDEASTALSSKEQISERIKIAKLYGKNFSKEKHLQSFIKLSSGFASSYALSQIITLSDFIFCLVEKKMIKKEMLNKMLPVYFKKTNKVSWNLFLVYLKQLSKYKFSFFSFNTILVLGFSIFPHKNNNIIIKIIKKYIPYSN